MFIERRPNIIIDVTASVNRFYHDLTSNPSALTCMLSEQLVLEVLGFGALGKNQRTHNRVRAIQHALAPLGIGPEKVDVTLKRSWVELKQLFYAASGWECSFITHDVSFHPPFLVIVLTEKPCITL